VNFCEFEKMISSTSSQARAASGSLTAFWRSLQGVQKTSSVIKSVQLQTSAQLSSDSSLLCAVNARSQIYAFKNSSQNSSDKKNFSTGFCLRNSEEKKTENSAEESNENNAEEISEKEKQLQEEVAQFKAKHDDLMDKYRRSIAESDNMRKRLTKQIEDAKVFGIQSFCKDLLDVADVLQTAIAAVPEDVKEKESQYFRDMLQGLELTESQLQQTFRRHGLEVENPLEEKFDPNKHEALFQMPSEDKEPNTILNVQKVGYILHGRTIRPAKVGVSRKP